MEQEKKGRRVAWHRDEGKIRERRRRKGNEEWNRSMREEENAREGGA